MRELGEVPEETRELAMSRFRLIQPHLEKNQPLQTVAADGKVPFRTAQLSGCAKFPESRSFVFNLFPGFTCIIAALKSRIIARKSRTKLMLKFVRDISTKMPLCPLYA